MRVTGKWVAAVIVVMVLGACSSGDRAEACSSMGQACCASTPHCRGSLVCGGSVTCTTRCGGAGEVCCFSAPSCADGLICDSGTCSTPCGGAGQACCASSQACSGTLSCQLGRCLGTGNCQTGRGDGTFEPLVTQDVGAGRVSLAVGDLDGDGRLDIAATDFTDGVIVLAGSCTGLDPRFGGFWTGEAVVSVPGRPPETTTGNFLSIEAFGSAARIDHICPDATGSISIPGSGNTLHWTGTLTCPPAPASTSCGAVTLTLTDVALVLADGRLRGQILGTESGCGSSDDAVFTFTFSPP